MHHGLRLLPRGRHPGHNIGHVHVEHGPKQPAEIPEHLVASFVIVRSAFFVPRLPNLLVCKNTIL